MRSPATNPAHDEGKHKARVFASALGMTVSDAEALREVLLEGAVTMEAQLGFEDAYGQRYSVDIPVDWFGRHAIIRSGWLVERGFEVPRLVSCYVL